jgi:hypothetical protein
MSTDIHRVPQLEYTLQLRTTVPEGSRAHGKGTTVVLEGHDITHLVSDIKLASNPTDATRLTIELVGVRLI